MKFWPGPILRDLIQLSTNAFTTKFILNGNNSQLARTKADNRNCHIGNHSEIFLLHT